MRTLKAGRSYTTNGGLTAHILHIHPNMPGYAHNNMVNGVALGYVLKDAATPIPMMWDLDGTRYHGEAGHNIVISKPKPQCVLDL